MTNKQVFRQVAMDRLSSPEQLDSLMQVTNAKSWLALLGMVVLVAVAAVWGFTGRIPVELTAPVVLLPTGGIKNVVSLHSGQVSDLRVAVGDVIEAGQVIAAVMPLGETTAQSVVSPYNGRILELKTDIGQLLQPGMPVVSLEPVGDKVYLEAVMYVSRSDAQQLTTDMLVKVTPENVQVEKYGFLLGRVASVGRFPATWQGIVNTMGSEELARAVVQVENPIEVHVELFTDSTTPSGLKWTTDIGPNFSLSSGTLGASLIVVDQQRPISLLFAN